MSSFCYLETKQKSTSCTRQCNTCRLDQRNKAEHEDSFYWYKKFNEQQEIIEKQKYAIAENCELRREIEYLKKRVEQEKSIAEFWRAKAVYENAGHVKYKTLFDSIGGLTINERR